MEREFRIILPKFDNAGQRISTDVLRDYAQQVAKHFGGVDVFPATLGCYYSKQEQRLQCEENIVIEATRNDATPDEVTADTLWMHKLAGEAARQLGQEEVFLQQDTATRTSFVQGHRKQELPANMLESDYFKKLIG